MKALLRTFGPIAIAILIACALFLAIVPRHAHAQQLQVATGDATGTYSTMFKQLSQRCSSGVALLEQNSDGSNDNINRLVGNQVNAVFVQSDVLWLRARTEELGNVKTLLALHPEQVHIVTRASSGLKEGGYLGSKIGGSDVVFSDITSLAGRRVGASGGSLVTAQVIRLQSDIAFNVMPFDKTKEVMAALDSNQIEAALFVGGAPLGTVAALGPQYKLVSIPPAVVEKLKAVYRPARLNYPKMGAAGVTTVSVDALFVTREYKTAKMTDGLAKLRACAQSSVDELKETTGTHPAWMQVDPSNHGKWPWMDLPAQRASK